MIRQASMEDIKIVAELAILLWEDNEIYNLENEIKEYITSNKGVIFICFEESVPVGFAQCNLRHDYVEGTENSPVGYLEGIFIKKEYRNKGFAKELLSQCEYWAKSQGCDEFASDCELNNTASLLFHLQVGFEESNRIICFKKKLCT